MPWGFQLLFTPEEEKFNPWCEEEEGEEAEEEEPTPTPKPPLLTLKLQLLLNLGEGEYPYRAAWNNDAEEAVAICNALASLYVYIPTFTARPISSAIQREKRGRNFPKFPVPDVPLPLSSTS